MRDSSWARRSRNRGDIMHTQHILSLGGLSAARCSRLLAGAALAVIFATPGTAFAQDSGKPPVSFNERYSAEPPATPPTTAPTTAPASAVERTGRVIRRAGARSRVLVAPRSFLDAGTEVLPGERKFLDYALPPLHMPMDVVTNTGGRVGWHNSPLPGPLFPSQN